MAEKIEEQGEGAQALKAGGARGASRSRTRSIAFAGLAIALMAVSAWVSVPLGPVPFTLQTFAMVFALLVLAPRACLASIVGYLALGAVGLPVFSSMRGGIGVLAGPTGGFLWGYVLGAVAALALLQVVGRLVRCNPDVAPGVGAASVGRASSRRRRPIGLDVAAGILFLAIMYVCGWAQLMVVAGLGPEAAFATAVAPFLVVDAVKLAAAVTCARAVRRALPAR